MWLMKRRGLLVQTLILFSIAMLAPACEVVPVVAAVPASKSLPIGTPTRASVVAPTPLPVMVTAANFKPEAALMTYPAWTRRVVCESNAAYSQNPLPGKTIHFQTPVDINPNGVPQVLDAIKNYEAMTSGAVTFRIVNSDPGVGIVVVEGDALNREGLPGCGHVTHQRDPKSGFTFNVKNNGTITRGCTFILVRACAITRARVSSRNPSPNTNWGTRWDWERILPVLLASKD
jgi:hypothetical protein